MCNSYNWQDCLSITFYSSYSTLMKTKFNMIRRTTVSENKFYEKKTFTWMVKVHILCVVAIILLSGRMIFFKWKSTVILQQTPNLRAWQTDKQTDRRNYLLFNENLDTLAYCRRPESDRLRGGEILTFCSLRSCSALKVDKSMLIPRTFSSSFDISSCAKANLLRDSDNWPSRHWIVSHLALTCHI